jgi:hypothetical protein
VSSVASRVAWPRDAGERPWWPVLRAAALALGIGLFIAVFAVYYVQPHDHFFGDSYVYLAAGERLNAGHPLYALSPGDRLVSILPPFWTTPLVSPPFIAVLWRPLAALPSESGTLVWSFASIAAIAGSAWWVLKRHPVAGGLGIALLSLPLAMEVGLGNVNGFLIAGTVALWVLRDRPWSGAILGVMIAVKIWPLALALWLLGQGRWRTLAWAAGALAVCGLVSLLGAGWDNHVAYLSVASSVHPSAFSLGFQLGIPWLWVPSLVLGLVLILVARSRSSWSYRLAVVTMVLGSPVVNPNTYAILLAAVAP